MSIKIPTIKEICKIYDCSTVEAKHRRQDYIKMNVPHEEIEQSTVVQFLEACNYKFTAIPNSTYTQSKRAKKKNKEQGLRPGLPDLLIVLKDRLLFVEMKREYGGTVSREQKEWIEALNKINNVEAIVCRGADEAIETIKKYDNV